MSNTIKLKRGSGSDPSASDLVVGELAIRTDSGKIFTKKDNGSVAEISGGGGISDGDKGDITVSNGGDTFTIDDGAVNNAKVASNAAIALTKLGTGNLPDTIGVLTANIAAGQLVTGHIAAGTAFQISNSNVASDAAIDVSKLNGVMPLAGGTFVNDVVFAGTNYNATWDKSASKFTFNDNAKATFGTGTANDMEIFHDSTSNTNKITATDGDISIQADNVDVAGDSTFNGDVDFKGSTGSTKILFDKSQDRLEVADNASIAFGDHPDYEIAYSNGNQFSIVGLHNGSDDFVIGHKNNSGNILKSLKSVRSTQAVELYYSDSKKFNTTNDGGTLTGNLFVTEALQLNDNKKIELGNSADLSISHDGTDNLLSASNGSIKLSAAAHYFNNADNSHNFIRCENISGNNLVSLHFNNSKKFETTSGGVKVSGTNLNMNSTYIDFSGSISTPTTAAAIYRPADNQLAFSTGNAERVKITNSGLDVAGNILVSGTVDGRDLATDGSKLDGIDAGATNVTNNNQLTNGAGYVTSNTTYDLSVPSGTTKIRLDPSDSSGNDDVEIAGGTNITVTRNNGNKLTIAGATQTDNNFTTTLKNKLDGIAAGATNVTNNNQISNGAGYLTDVSTSDIDNSAITTDKLNNSAVTTNKINNSAVTTDKLNNSAVTTNKINNDAVTLAKIENFDSGRIMGRLASGSGDCSQLTAASVRTILNVADGATNVTNNNQLTNGAGYTTFDGDYNSLSNRPTIPTNNNQLTNGAGYITSSSIPTVTGAAKKFVNFDGTNNSIRNDLGVSSISDHGAGQYTVNFDGNFDNTNYTITHGIYRGSGKVLYHFDIDNSITTSSHRFMISAANNVGNVGLVARDTDQLHLAFFLN